MKGCTLILEKPITPSEFDTLIECEHLKEADSLIRVLNKRVKGHELELEWGSRPESNAVIAVVNDHYQKFGWDGVTQHMVTSNNTRIMTTDEMKEGTISGKVIITVLRKKAEENRV